MTRVVLPYHLRALAKVEGEVVVDVAERLLEAERDKRQHGIIDTLLIRR